MCKSRVFQVKPILAKSMAGVGDATVRKASVAEFPTVERIGEDGSLLDGTYNEASSAQSFQDAWTEWHSGNTAVSYKQCNTSSEGMCLFYTHLSLSIII